MISQRSIAQITTFVITIVLVASTSVSCNAYNVKHIMHLYKGLVNHSNSDIILIVDSSDGIKERIFNEMRNLSEMAVQCLKHVKQSRIAVVSFAEKVHVIHRFDQCQNGKCISDALKRLRLTGGKRATGRALREAKRMLKQNGRKHVKWTIVMITFGSPRIGKRRTAVVAKRLRRIGADMFLLAVGKKAFNNYVPLKNIASPFERNNNKQLQRLFFFRGPQHESDFMMTKAVLNLVCPKNNKYRGFSRLKSFG